MYFVILYFVNIVLLLQVIFLRKHIILTLYLILKRTFSDLPQLSILSLQVFKSLETRVWTVTIKEISTFTHSKTREHLWIRCHGSSFQGNLVRWCAIKFDCYLAFDMGYNVQLGILLCCLFHKILVSIARRAYCPFHFFMYMHFSSIYIKEKMLRFFLPW